jgi:DNA-directed RNA polymerase subunit RPC12/RpoP
MAIPIVPMWIGQWSAGQIVVAPVVAGLPLSLAVGEVVYGCGACGAALVVEGPPPGPPRLDEEGHPVLIRCPFCGRYNEMP